MPDGPIFDTLTAGEATLFRLVLHFWTITGWGDHITTHLKLLESTTTALVHRGDTSHNRVGIKRLQKYAVVNIFGLCTAIYGYSFHVL